MQAEEAKRLTQLESENARLKKLLAEAELEKAMFKELAGETFKPVTTSQSCRGLLAMFRVSERSSCRVVGQHRSTQRHAIKVVDIEVAKLRRRLREIASEHIPGVGRWRIVCSGGKAGW